MKIKILLQLLITSMLCFGQDIRHPKDFFKRSYEISNSAKLKKYEFKLSEIERQLLFEKYTYPQDSFYKIEKRDVFFINLNGDEYPDVVYISPFGEDNVFIDIGTQKGFKRVLNSDEFLSNCIKELKFRGRKCIEVVLERLNMVSDDEQAEIVYRLVKDSFELFSCRTCNVCTQKPYKYLKKPINVQILIDSCPLRENPNFEEGKCFYDGAISTKANNEIGKFKYLTSGICWAEFIDNTRNLWWLVELALKDQNKESHSNDINDKNFGKEYQIGWMEAKFLKKIK